MQKISDFRKICTFFLQKSGNVAIFFAKFYEILVDAATTTAIKYAFFQVFRDLQDYLADFLKKLQIFAKNRKICKKFAKFPDFSRKSADFCENL